VPSADPAVVAMYFLTKVTDKSGRLVLRRWHGDWWQYKAGAYYALEKDTFDVLIWTYIAKLWLMTPKGPKRFPTSVSKVANIEHALISLGTLIDQAANPPVWIGGSSDMVLRDIAVCANGILELASGRLLDLTPELFVTSNIATAWDQHASPRPREWMTFLESVFGEDWKAVELLQEWFGYCISTDTSQHKFLFLIGPPRSGKGTIQRVLTALLGPGNVASPSLSSLATPFGLQTLISKSLATVSDARLSGRADQAVIVERILSITGEDMIDIDRKHKPPISIRLPTRVMIASNELPKLSDSSGALTKRTLLLELRKSFYGQEDMELEARLLGELTEILAWAVEGWQRLKERGRFDPPASSQDAMADFEALTAPIKTFVEDYCTTEADDWIEIGSLFQRWKDFAEESNFNPGTIQTFTRNLKAAVPSIRSFRPRGTTARKRCFQGITVQTSI
jgi:putative DNA primase/helicase